LCRARKTGHEISSLAYPQVCKQFKPEVGKVHICIPMMIAGRAGGVVQFLFDDPQGDQVRAEALRERIFKAEAYLKQSLSVIEAKRLMNTLRESALKDPLTGLYNRRFLQDHANHIISGTLRRKKCLGMIMCDLDYFKQVNDQHGHDIGDVVLKETAHLILSGVREADIVLRFGGEEFFILLTDINTGDALLVAEKIRASFEEYKFKIPSGVLKKTLSLGVSEFPNDSEGFWQCIKYADVALYKAKDGGRNKAIQFDPKMWEGEQF
jgi:diguanylate cyclase (GGDEF)-like protein